MADAATTADAVRTDTGTGDDHSFLRRRRVAWLVFLLLSVGTLSILFQLRFGTVG